jgi:glutamate-1-semialdehyde 2,1-aminomutase
MTGVTPHLASFGKALGNGFSCSFIAGKRELMELGGIDGSQERVFLLSTTHGGETHCLAAAKAVINEIKKHDIIDHFWWVGKTLQDGVKKIAEETQTSQFVHVSGYACKPSFAFLDETGEVSNVARTLFLQESIARGLLMPYVVPSWAHKGEHLAFALEVIGDALQAMKRATEEGGMKHAINGDCVKPVFRKYN